MRILVTGGAGYIGSFMVKALLNRGDEVVIADSLKRGREKSLDSRASFKKGNLLDKEFVFSLFENPYDAVMHFAAYIAVEESVSSPALYFQNNIYSTLNLLEEMARTNTTNFIFSSTGTVYGHPQIIPIPETHPTNPSNPYSQSKLMVEFLLDWYYKNRQIGYAVLRYFNASGGSLDGSMGEDHSPETHLIPNAIRSAISGTAFNLFGNDYPTKDGSAVRDYIHVLDLVEAHLLTLKKLGEEQGGYIWNVGTGKGSSNKEVVEMVKKISGKDFPIEMSPRRPGDVAETVADVIKIKNELGFIPKHSDLQTIVESAYKWHIKKN